MLYVKIRREFYGEDVKIERKRIEEVLYMRRKDRERDREFAFMVVDKCEYAVLSVIDTEGKPYGVPISIARQGEVIYFHCAKEGKKADAVRKHREVCISCVGDTKREEDKFTTKYESAILFGTAEEVTQEEEKIMALRLLCERHTPTNMGNFDKAVEQSLARTAVWKIQINGITGKCKE